MLHSIFSEHRIPEQSSNHSIVRRVCRLSTSGPGLEPPSIPEPASHLEHLSRASNLEHSSGTHFQYGTCDLEPGSRSQQLKYPNYEDS